MENAGERHNNAREQVRGSPGCEPRSGGSEGRWRCAVACNRPSHPSTQAPRGLKRPAAAEPSPAKEGVQQKKKPSKKDRRRVSFAPDPELTLVHHFDKVGGCPARYLLAVSLSMLHACPTAS